jgi:hypothetical protein
VCLALTLMGAGCGPSDAADAEPSPADPPRGLPVPVTRLPAREMQFVEPGAMVIRTDEEWRALWKRYRPSAGEPPAVDFALQAACHPGKPGRALQKDGPHAEVAEDAEN